MAASQTGCSTCCKFQCILRRGVDACASHTTQTEVASECSREQQCVLGLPSFVLPSPSPERKSLCGRRAEGPKGHCTQGPKSRKAVNWLWGWLACHRALVRDVLVCFLGQRMWAERGHLCAVLALPFSLFSVGNLLYVDCVTKLARLPLQHNQLQTSGVQHKVERARLVQGH